MLSCATNTENARHFTGQASGAHQVWCRGRNCLLTTVARIWHYLYVVIDIYGHTVLTWDIAEKMRSPNRS